jgi:hypothetical protein
MTLFPETIKTALAGRKVQCANLVLFDFATDAVRLWKGNGMLVTNDGEAWFATGSFGDMDGIEQAINGEAPQATFTLSGIDAEIMHTARDEFASEAKGRMARVYLQFFGQDDPDDPENQRPLDLPFPVWGGRMLQPQFALAEGDDGSPAARSVTISCESLFSLRGRPRWAMHTDADQQHRFPGDQGVQFVASLVRKVTTWPDF